jgi:hypothetical protein
LATTKPSPKPRTRARTTAAPVSTGIGLSYEWFLELPVAVVLLVLWVGGVALLGACALVAYVLISVLVVVG